MNIRRGMIVLVRLDPVIGSEQGKTRPAVVLQNDIGNEHSPTTIVGSITSKIFQREYPTDVRIHQSESRLSEESSILLSQIRTIDKSRIVKKISQLGAVTMKKVDLAIKTSLDLG